MLLETINLIKISNDAFKQTRCYNGGMEVKIHSDRFSHIHGIASILKAYSGIFRDNQAYSGTIQGFSGTFRSLCDPGIFRTLTYLEPQYIPSPGSFRILVYSEPWYIQNQSHIQNPGIFRTSTLFTTLLNICNIITKIMQILFCTFSKYGNC